MFLSRYGPYVSFRRTFEWVRRRYVFLLASLAGYVVLFPLVLWFAMDTTPTAFKGFVGLDPATYRIALVVGTLATILWIANGGIVIPLAFLGSAAGLMFYARPRWQDWADVRDALWGRGAGWKGDGASE